jgi:predicted nicotinamide N-methyase
VAAPSYAVAISGTFDAPSILFAVLTAPDEMAFKRLLGRHVPLRHVKGLKALRAHQAATLETAWAEVAQRWPGAAASPPYWAVAWPGGRALARQLLQEPEEIRGLRVLEIGCGGAVAAIAAAQSGAAEVTAVDIDPLACLAARANAAANGVSLKVLQVDMLAGSGDQRWDLILAADLWYERFFAHRVSSWLHERAADGCRVLLADLGRAFLPRKGLLELARIDLIDSLGTEQGSDLCVRICQVTPPTLQDLRVSAESTVAHQACV